MGEEFLGLLVYCVPALVTGAVAFLFFREHVTNENNRRNFLLHQMHKKESFPIRLQAFERLTLFLERISAHQLMRRVAPIAPQPEAYKALLIQTIEQEYEHNLSQQIYVSDSCWRMLTTAKNSSIQRIQNFEVPQAIKTAQEMKAPLFETLSQAKVTPEMALTFLKEEVGLLIQ
ncbi:MAG: Uncharacterised protein [Formosa sp. Hel3_A1_48]|nr:MAG: Uncharacterised protein [Formosa sp. Hel3_A1_48]